MKKYSRVFSYLKLYKGQIVLYFICIILSIVFSVVSLGMLAPFFDLIFKGDNAGVVPKADSPITAYIRHILITQVGDLNPKGALAFICIIIIGSILLKNLFLYLSFNILNPIKNSIVNTLRSELYAKILGLPIGYFTEKRKGDLISRITNDVAEVEVSLVGALEGWIRDPLTIIINFAVLFYISPQLTIAILVCIPMVGFVLGRISRSLRKQSNEAAIKLGESLSVLDETLNGLRVIKAFNIESLLKGRFGKINDELLHAKNKISRRRDMASPMSEFLGVLVFVGILWFGGQMVLGNQINLSPSMFLAYLAMFYNIINPVKTLSTSFSNLQKGSSAILRIEEILKTKVMVDDNPGGKKLNAFNINIEFRNAGFAYDDAVILNKINVIIG
ncbi:MAG TPA: ABC transporter transmembrane domain-containing protein, partial [Agriterribacter sp.]|nr:ABC transporter transmembrane domain-containing protein [Agriterribacter sp.]